MKRLSVRLLMALLLTSWISVGAMALVVQRTLDAGFRHYITLRDSETNPDQLARLENYYATNASWEGVPLATSGRTNNNGNSAGRGAVLAILDEQGRIITTTDSAFNTAQLPEEWRTVASELRVDGEVVGFFYRYSPSLQVLGEAEEAFLAEANRWLTLAGLGATGLALIIGATLAWTLTAPLQALTQAVQALMAGKLGQQVSIRGTTEVEVLASEFNAMSTALAEADTLRQRMATDIAHELRTPVTVLKGHLEAMLDGVYPVDSAHLATAHDQTIHLGRLVEDLRVLTLAEAKRLPLARNAFDPMPMVAQLIEDFEPLAIDSGVSLKHTLSTNNQLILADITRIRQVLSNLLSNALRHTPSGGEICVKMVTCIQGVYFSVSNSGELLSEEEMHHIFQPFWRAEPARTRDTNGSGLGLAISHEIIALHNSRLVVANNQNGVTFSFILESVILREE